MNLHRPRGLVLASHPNLENIMTRPCFPIGVCCLTAALLTGCTVSTDPTIAAQRERLLLDEEPPGAVGVLDLAESLVDDQQAESLQVVVLGKIGGVENPWTDGMATFVIADPFLLMELEDGPHGADCDCPFCRASSESSNTDGMALVQVLDDQGRIIPIDARELLGIENDETIVIQGQASVNQLGHLVLSANGVYVRR